jgi:hypothetical protein
MLAFWLAVVGSDFPAIGSTKTPVFKRRALTIVKIIA